MRTKSRKQRKKVKNNDNKHSRFFTALFQSIYNGSARFIQKYIRRKQSSSSSTGSFIVPHKASIEKRRHTARVLRKRKAREIVYSVKHIFEDKVYPVVFKASTYVNKEILTVIASLTKYYLHWTYGKSNLIKDMETPNSHEDPYCSVCHSQCSPNSLTYSPIHKDGPVCMTCYYELMTQQSPAIDTSMSVKESISMPTTPRSPQSPSPLFIMNDELSSTNSSLDHSQYKLFTTPQSSSCELLDESSYISPLPSIPALSMNTKDPWKEFTSLYEHSIIPIPTQPNLTTPLNPPLSLPITKDTCDNQSPNSFVFIQNPNDSGYESESELNEKLHYSFEDEYEIID